MCQKKALAKMTRGHTTNNTLDIYAKKGDIRHDIEEILGKHLFSYDNQKTLTGLVALDKFEISLSSLSF